MQWVAPPFLTTPLPSTAGGAALRISLRSVACAASDPAISGSGILFP
ncbi:MAG: hypothetical protein R3F11_07765 [Verrucomicrobiales bacterium]